MNTVKFKKEEKKRKEKKYHEVIKCVWENMENHFHAFYPKSSPNIMQSSIQSG